MGFDPAAAKRPVTVTLNEDLLRQADRHTGNLSNTLEALLAEFVTREDVRTLDNETVVEALREFSAIHEKYGLLSEQYQDV